MHTRLRSRLNPEHAVLTPPPSPFYALSRHPFLRALLLPAHTITNAAKLTVDGLRCAELPLDNIDGPRRR